MAIENSTEQLVERIRRDAKAAKGSTYWDAATLLGMADTETRSLVVQQVAASTGEYLVRYVDVPLAPGKRAYRQPSRAIRLKEVERYDADGNPLPFSLIDSAQAAKFRGSGGHWHFEEGAVVPLLEEGASGGFLRMRYYRWPSRLVMPDECARVDSLDYVDGEGYHLLVPDFERLGAMDSAVTLDIVQSTSPFESYADGVLARIQDDAHVAVDPDTISGNLSADLDGTQYLCPSGTTCFPQLPLVFHDVLVELVAARVRREMNDAQGAADAKASATEKMGSAVAVSSPRSKAGNVVSGSPWLR